MFVTIDATLTLNFLETFAICWTMDSVYIWSANLEYNPDEIFPHKIQYKHKYKHVPAAINNKEIGTLDFRNALKTFDNR